MDTVVSGRLQIDRLSSLPPELLLTIFDLSYDPDHLLLEPLSKRLLPYFRRNLYRQIRISSQSSFIKLLRTVCTNARLGQLVQDLDTNAIFGANPVNDLEMIVKAFPRLLSFDSGDIELIEPFQSSTLSTLRSLSYSCYTFELQDLDTLSRFPVLSQLEVACNNLFLPYPIDPSIRLAALNTLTLSLNPRSVAESEVWPRYLPLLVERCPNLTQLELSDTLRPFFVKALPDLAPLLPLLDTLNIEVSEPLSDFYGIVCDRYLPLFPNLRHLDLADNTVSNTLPTYLRQLPHLGSLRLGLNVHLDGPTSQDILSLVSGPSKLVKLEKLVLDCVEGSMGKRWDIDEMEGNVDKGGFEAGIAPLQDWNKPDFSERFEAEDICQVILAGQQNGIEISGSAVDSVSIWNAYYLEIANRRVLKAFKSKSFVDLIRMKGWDYHRCPDVDFDKLDPNNLNLVKIELPEENWFALTLE
ncbi:hypothetical protein JCM5353_004918 [Sporobolomyces roseus]